jgi:hypothetical protein
MRLDLLPQKWKKWKRLTRIGRLRVIRGELISRGFNIPSDAGFVRVCLGEAKNRLCFYPIQFFTDHPNGIKAGIVTCPNCGLDQPVTNDGKIPDLHIFGLPPYNDLYGRH